MKGLRIRFNFTWIIALLVISTNSIQAQGQNISITCEYVGASEGQPLYNCGGYDATIADWVGYYPGDKQALNRQGQPVNFYQFLLNQPELFENIPEPGLSYLRQQLQQQADDLIRQIHTADQYPPITQVQDWIIAQSYRCDPNTCLDLSVMMYEPSTQKITVCILSLPSKPIALNSLTPTIIGELEVQLFTSFPDKTGYSFSKPMKELQQEPGYACGNPTHNPLLIVQNLQMLENNFIKQHQLSVTPSNP